MPLFYAAVRRLRYSPFRPFPSDVSLLLKRDGDGREVDPNGQSDVFAENVEVDDVQADLNKNVKDLTDPKDDSIDVKMKKLAIDLEQTCQRVGADTERILKAAVESSIKENVEIAVKAALSDKKQEEHRVFLI